jgi:hypothetical protein
MHPLSRSRSSAKNAGTSFETLIASYLALHVDDRIERRAKSGAKDRGDISGLRVLGNRVVVEAKDYGGRMLPGTWVEEAAVEAGNDDAAAGIVAIKRKGTRAAGDQFVLMTVDDLVTLITGDRP